MNALFLLAVEPDERRTDRADRQDLWRGLASSGWPRSSASPLSVILLHRFAYKPILKMLEERRQQIAQGIADTEKIRAELAQTEAQRREIMLQGQRAGDQADRGSPRRGRPSTGAGNSEGHRCRRTDHRQGARGRRPGTRPHARRTEARGGPIGCADHRQSHRQDPDCRRSAAPGGGNRSNWRSAA